MRYLSPSEAYLDWLIFLPSILALSLSLIIRNAFLALSFGAFIGALIINWNQWLELPKYLANIFFINHFFSSWKMGAFILTLQLGAFSAVLDKNKSLERFFDYINSSYQNKKKSLTTLALMGLVCFYDGLANSILLGRLSLGLKKRFAVSNEKLAYIVDSTSSSVSCLVIFSTWTAYQISLIQTSLNGSIYEGQGLQVLIQSIPFNLYSILTLIMVFIVIIKDWNFGPMKATEIYAKSVFTEEHTPKEVLDSYSILKAALPLLVLFFSFIFFVALLSIFVAPETSAFKKFIFTLSDNRIPWLLNLSALCSWLCLLALREKKLLSLRQSIYESINGIFQILKPCMILFGAWALSTVISDLGAGRVISEYFIQLNIQPVFIPLSIFIISCLVAFFTGTSWGTLALLIPLVVPLAADLGVNSYLTSATLGAIFGGAVFGDHCSPLSDTSVVSAFSTECELKSHITTQMPYALTVVGITSAIYILLAYTIF